MTIFKRFLKDQSGATAIEYGLIGVLVAVATVGGITALGSTVNNTFSTMSTTANTAMGG